MHMKGEPDSATFWRNLCGALIAYAAPQTERVELSAAEIAHVVMRDGGANVLIDHRGDFVVLRIVDDEAAQALVDSGMVKPK